ncbi:acetate/propionate family kinase [Phenylobacterium sp. 58.2.17]|uniref:acetate/propionate family kinase n=1 Tax=Phenylobacterium sp. 58.2.17 TaxID=2969306 RepID=UPI0022641A08|nr:acetate/propionate family kinase [Phenylobacterium sp. 58.2.17]MCX7585750.1 acetate/propionate family kinase [Phenylobacterium sp. 58.2.17]
MREGASILTLNVGSSSLKFAVYEAVAGLPLKMEGQISGLNGTPRMRARAAGAARLDELWGEQLGLETVLDRLFDWLALDGWTADLAAVGHRIVHGGRDFHQPRILSAEVRAKLEELCSLAPLHQPFNLRGVEIAERRLPGVLQVGVFDTAFHADQPEAARLYALPRDLIDDGVVAYGFHGLSYDYIAGVLRELDAEKAGGRAIVLHLGSGGSLCAMDRGRSVATTMGFSALEGPPMSTRSGSLDPGVVLYLLQSRGMSPAAVSDLLYRRSGLLGLSGLSGDMVTLLASSAPHAKQALEVYVYRIAREIGSLAAALGGLDTLVFTAGVGENAPAIRERVVELCGWIGAKLDTAANQAGARRIDAGGEVKILVVPTDEQLVIARGVYGCIQGEQAPAALGAAGSPLRPPGA